ncbi:MAG TPA: ChrR family anti-sigma-E factor [Geminicoccaceae bacterium]|nr:ChrR family anti-sigma-E factor [Geminicoccaceae bacterium]
MPRPVAGPTHHPGDERLVDYASGALPEPVALLVATHLALCPRCRGVALELEAVGGALLEELPPEPMAADSLQRVLARIEQPHAIPEKDQPERAAEGDPSLPRPLRDYIGGTLDALPWRRLGPIAEVQLLRDFPGFTTRLLRIRGGTAVPVHTHRGSELTLVLSGAFSDEEGHYLPGDVEETDGEITHRPVADAGADCLCLAVTDAPLKLTGSFGRLLNPFVRI